MREVFVIRDVETGKFYEPKFPFGGVNFVKIDETFDGRYSSYKEAMDELESVVMYNFPGLYQIDKIFTERK